MTPKVALSLLVLIRGHSRGRSGGPDGTTQAAITVSGSPNVKEFEIMDNSQIDR